jgi:hypothetical protein
MATTITFTDTVGAATLSNGKTAPMDRFANWVPISRPVGDSAYRQSDRAMTRFTFGTDFGASFELRMIPIKTSGGLRLVEIADRLVFHLLNGGTCAVNTGDVDSSAYATCGLMPNTEPSLIQSNARLLEYTLSLSLINLAGSPVRMVCRYLS